MKINQHEINASRNLTILHKITMLEWNGWQRKQKPLFRFKRPRMHPAWKIYKEVCNCDETYIKKPSKCRDYVGWA